MLLEYRLQAPSIQGLSKIVFLKPGLSHFRE
jgi:hypothetical protein